MLRTCCKKGDVENSTAVEVLGIFPTVEEVVYDKLVLDLLESSSLLESHSKRMSEGLKTGIVGCGIRAIAGVPATMWNQLATDVAEVTGTAAGDGSKKGGATAAAGRR